MKVDESGVRSLTSAALVALLVVVAVYLWFIDIFTMQKEFGAFLAAELTAFAMLLYVYLKPTYGEFKKQWFLVGCLFLALCLALAIL